MFVSDFFAERFFLTVEMIFVSVSSIFAVDKGATDLITFLTFG